MDIGESLPEATCELVYSDSGTCDLAGTRRSILCLYASHNCKSITQSAMLSCVKRPGNVQLNILQDDPPRVPTKYSGLAAVARVDCEDALDERVQLSRELKVRRDAELQIICSTVLSRRMSQSSRPLSSNSTAHYKLFDAPPRALCSQRQ